MTDRDLQEHVQKALDWEPSIDAADIGVSVDNGVVTLRGDVNCSRWVDSIDAALVLQFDAGLVRSLACQHAADVNGDRRINSVDAALILQLDAGLIRYSSLPP
jgi:hypothetical protein